MSVRDDEASELGGSVRVLMMFLFVVVFGSLIALANTVITGGIGREVRALGFRDIGEFKARHDKVLAELMADSTTADTSYTKHVGALLKLNVMDLPSPRVIELAAASFQKRVDETKAALEAYRGSRTEILASLGRADLLTRLLVVCACAALGILWLGWLRRHETHAIKSDP